MQNTHKDSDGPDESRGEPNNNHTRKRRHRRHKEKLKRCIRWLTVNRKVILLVFGLIKPFIEIWNLFFSKHD